MDTTKICFKFLIICYFYWKSKMALTRIYDLSKPHLCLANYEMLLDTRSLPRTTRNACSNYISTIFMHAEVNTLHA